MLIPYELDVPFEREPWMNWLLVGSIAAVFVLQAAWWIQTPTEGNLDQSPFGPYILRHFNGKELFGHMWLHSGILHLIGNLIFLWVFGNAVCQKIGNLIYLPIYLFLGLSAAVASLIFIPDIDKGMIGASGAINGIVGMYVVLYPRNDISVFYWFFLIATGTFEISGYWMVLMWLAFDILGAVEGGSNVAHFAHLGGFFAGAGVAVLLLLTRRVVMDEKYEESLLDLIREEIHPKPEPARLKSWLEIEMAREAGELEEHTKTGLSPESTSVPQRGRRSNQPALSGTDIVPADSNEPENPPIPSKTEAPVAAQKYIRYACSCGKRIKTPAEYAGQTGKCPQCKKRLVIPDGPIR